jgi:predicted Zn-dependent peptidase
MALTTKQRNALPPSAFLDRSNRRFPVPTKQQARRAHISEAQRVRTLRNALSRAAQRQARGVKKVTPTMVARKVKSRGAGQVQSVVQRRGRPLNASTRHTRARSRIRTGSRRRRRR